MEPDYRIERKYPITEEGLHEFRYWHRFHGIEFLCAFPPRTINNIYFDSPEWNCYSDNMSGISNRSKCRLRWYGDMLGSKTAQFEAKCRRNSVGFKLQQEIARADCDFGELMGLYSRLRAILRPELRLRLDRCHQPMLFNRYQREYYETDDGIRLTVDSGIHFSSLEGPTLRRDKLIVSAAPAVIELKYPIHQRRFVERYLAAFPFRGTRNSKYVIGINHIFSS